MIIGVVFSGLSGVLWGIHNAYGQFYYPAAVGIVFNVLLLTTTIFLRRWFGFNALAYGFLIGVIGRFTVQFVPLTWERKLGLPARIWHPALRTMSGLFLPVFISGGVSTINLIVNRMLATHLPEGQITDFTYAGKIGMLQHCRGNVHCRYALHALRVI